MRIRFTLLLFAAGLAVAQAPAADTDESAYAPSTLAKIMGGAARSQNDEAELAGPSQWFTTSANYTGHQRKPSGRFKPLIGAWLSSRGQDESAADIYFGGDLPELEFEQGGRRFWIIGGLPGGIGFDVYPPGQKLTIYLQKVGYASGTPVAVLIMAKLPAGGAATTVPQGRLMRKVPLGEGTRRQEGTYKTGSVKFSYAGREYSLPLDPAGRHSIAPGLYSYENGVRAALLEFGADDSQYLLLRVPAADSTDATGIAPYLVLKGRIVPPIDLSACRVELEPVTRKSTRGSVDCSASPRAALSKLTFTAE